jgi:KDO2-lipid IV(A) lauroyltransferase
MDFGPAESIFVPFFGVLAATVPALSRLAAMTGARVVPIHTRMLPGGAGYVVRVHPPLDGFPSGDIEADTRRMNAWIEDRLLEPGMLPQYHWAHRRFKTRPPGEPPLYD